MKKIVKSYDEDGVRYRFSDKKLQMYANQLKSDLQIHGKKKNKSDIQKELADKLFVSEDAVKNWMYGYNAPSDLEQVKLIAEYFGVDYHQLLDKEETEMAANNMVNVASGIANEEQMMCTKKKVRKLYKRVLGTIDAIMEYLYIEEYYADEDHNNEEYVRESEEAYAHASAICSGTRDFMERNMLDIPESLSNKVDELIWADLQIELRNIVIVFNQDREDIEKLSKERIDEAKQWFRQCRNHYLKELREIFADYMVK